MILYKRPIKAQTGTRTGEDIYNSLVNDKTNSTRDLIYADKAVKDKLFKYVSGIKLDDGTAKMMNGLGYVNNVFDATGQAMSDVASLAVTPTYKTIRSIANGSNPFQESMDELTKTPNNVTVNDAISTAGNFGVNAAMTAADLATGGSGGRITRKGLKYADDAAELVAKVNNKKSYINNLVGNQIERNTKKLVPIKNSMAVLDGSMPQIQKDSGLTKYLLDNKLIGPYARDQKYSVDSFYGNRKIYAAYASRYVKETGSVPNGYKAFGDWIKKRSTLMNDVDKYTYRIANSKNRIERNAESINELLPKINELINMSSKPHPTDLARRLTELIMQGGAKASAARELLEKISNGEQ